MPKKGYKQTEEHKQKHFKHLSEDHKQKLIETNIGRHCSEETKRKISEAHLGKSLSEEHKKKLSKAKVGKKCKPFSDETKQNMREAQLGKHLSEETKEKIREANLGKQQSEKTKEKERKARLGKHHSEETKQKMSGKNNSRWNGGKKAAQMRSDEQRRGLGHVELNDAFEGCDGHHLDKELVLYIPSELHRSVRHNQFTGQGMEEINDLAQEFLLTKMGEC